MGRWVTQSKDGVVEVYPCGENLCGKLSKFLVNPPAGPGAKDINNPDKALDPPSVLGTFRVGEATALDPAGHGVQLYFSMEQVGRDGRASPPAPRTLPPPGEWPEAIEATPDVYMGEVFPGPWG
jgi:hypothetical protein